MHQFAVCGGRLDVRPLFTFLFVPGTLPTISLEHSGCGNETKSDSNTQQRIGQASAP